MRMGLPGCAACESLQLRRERQHGGPGIHGRQADHVHLRQWRTDGLLAARDERRVPLYRRGIVVGLAASAADTGDVTSRAPDDDSQGGKRREHRLLQQAGPG